MSLLADAMEPCVLLDKRTEADGYGGTITRYVEGAEIECAVTLDTSIEARIAEQQGVTSIYNVVTSRSITLEYHDVFKRLKDGKIFRVTSDGDDMYTPKTTSLDMRLATAEEWTLPNG